MSHRNIILRRYKLNNQRIIPAKHEVVIILILCMMLGIYVGEVLQGL